MNVLKHKLSLSIPQIVFFCSLALAVAVQMLLGFVNVTFFAFPLNAILLAIIVYVAFAERHYCKRRQRQSALSSIPMSLTVIAAMVAVSLLLGFIPQDEPMGLNLHVLSRLGLFHITISWPFACVMFWFMLVLTSVIVRRAFAPITWRNVFFMLNHVGLWIAVASAFFGSCDTITMRLPINREQANSTAYTLDGEQRTLPYAIQLQNFSVEYYDSGEPSSYAADIQLLDGQRTTQAQIKVNAPFRYAGGDIYLSSYDVEGGANARFCIVQIVEQPWKYAIYFGIGLMLLGSIFLFIPQKRLKTAQVQTSNTSKSVLE